MTKTKPMSPEEIESLIKERNILRWGYTGFGDCPGCVRVDGRIVAHCGLHHQIADLRAEIERLGNKA